MLEITQIHDSDGIWYCPDIQDNRELPEDERFSVLIVPMTAEQMRRVEESHGTVTKKKINFTRRYNRVRGDTLAKCIRDVEGCRVKILKNGKEEIRIIKTGQALVEVVNEEILEDIYQALRDHSLLEQGMKKNYEQRSDLPISLPSHKDSGVARDVIPLSQKDTPEVMTKKSI